MIEALLAADIYLTLGGVSIHSSGTYSECVAKNECIEVNYNENHKAVILDVEGFTVGTFVNSFSERTNLVGYTHRIDDFSITAAYGTGYDDHFGLDRCTIDLGKECLLVTASYSFEPFKLSLMSNSVAISFEFKLSKH